MTNSGYIFKPSKREIAESRRRRIEELREWGEFCGLTDEEKRELDVLLEEERLCL